MSTFSTASAAPAPLSPVSNSSPVPPARQLKSETQIRAHYEQIKDTFGRWAYPIEKERGGKMYAYICGVWPIKHTFQVSFETPGALGIEVEAVDKGLKLGETYNLRVINMGTGTEFKGDVAIPFGSIIAMAGNRDLATMNFTDAQQAVRDEEDDARREERYVKLTLILPRSANNYTDSIILKEITKEIAAAAAAAAAAKEEGQAEEAPAPQISETRESQLRAIFARADRNSDGHLTRAELILRLRKDTELASLLNLPQQVGDDQRAVFESVFQSMDVDADREVDADEFVSFFTQPQTPPESPAPVADRAEDSAAAKEEGQLDNTRVKWTAFIVPTKLLGQTAAAQSGGSTGRDERSLMQEQTGGWGGPRAEGISVLETIHNAHESGQPGLDTKMEVVGVQGRAVTKIYNVLKVTQNGVHPRTGARTYQVKFYAGKENIPNKPKLYEVLKDYMSLDVRGDFDRKICTSIDLVNRPFEFAFSDFDFGKAEGIDFGITPLQQKQFLDLQKHLFEYFQNEKKTAAEIPECYNNFSPPDMGKNQDQAGGAGELLRGGAGVHADGQGGDTRPRRQAAIVEAERPGRQRQREAGISTDLVVAPVNDKAGFQTVKEVGSRHVIMDPWHAAVLQFYFWLIYFNLLEAGMEGVGSRGRLKGILIGIGATVLGAIAITGIGLFVELGIGAFIGGSALFQGVVMGAGTMLVTDAAAEHLGGGGGGINGSRIALVNKYYKNAMKLNRKAGIRYERKTRRRRKRKTRRTSKRRKTQKKKITRRNRKRNTRKKPKIR